MTDQLNFDTEVKPTLPSVLNVLTILTFVGSGLGIIGGIYSFISAEKSYQAILKAQDSLADAPGWAKGMVGPEALEMAKKTMENKWPIMLLTLVGAALCIYGALEMRKLKKQGFILWLTGELLPVLALILFIGLGSFKGFAAIGMIFPIIFIILYALQRKHLVY
jgi:hypothetical protein